MQPIKSGAAHQTSRPLQVGARHSGDATRAYRRGARPTMHFAAVHSVAIGRFCCKSPKLPGDKFPATRRTNRRSAICVASIALPKSPVSSSSGDEVPHIFTRKSRLRPGEFLIISAKGLLQQYRHKADKARCLPGCPLLEVKRIGRSRCLVWSDASHP